MASQGLGCFSGGGLHNRRKSAINGWDVFQRDELLTMDKCFSTEISSGQDYRRHDWSWRVELFMDLRTRDKRFCGEIRFRTKSFGCASGDRIVFTADVFKPGFYKKSLNGRGAAPVERTVR